MLQTPLPDANNDRARQTPIMTSASKKNVRVRAEKYTYIYKYIYINTVYIKYTCLLLHAACNLLIGRLSLHRNRCLKDVHNLHENLAAKTRVSELPWASLGLTSTFDAPDMVWSSSLVTSGQRL